MITLCILWYPTVVFIYTPETQIFFIYFFKQEMKDLQIQIASLSESENNLLRANEKLREKVEHLQQENRSARSQAEKAQHDVEKWDFLLWLILLLFLYFNAREVWI